MSNQKYDLITTLKETLSEDKRFIDENGELIKASITSASMQLEPDFISLLLSNEMIKSVFFKEIDNVLVFDKVKFNWVVSNKQFLPDSYTKYKNKIGLSDNDYDLITENKNISLVFPYKDSVLEGGQTDEKEQKDEVFYNETLSFDQVRNLLSPKALTNAKKYINNGVEETTDIDKTDNLLIKGNNLLALSSLLENYRNKIKLIYIDPPYNTGNDSFHYNDKFNHSTWLTFMKNRLEIAKDLLSNDGLIFVQIDKNEEFYLKVLMDDIFGREFFVNSITVQSSTASGNKTAHRDKTIIKTKDTILVYKKTNQIVLNPQYTEQNKWDTHFNSILIKEGDKYVTYSLRDYMIQQNIIDKNYKIRDKSISDDFFLDFVFANKDKIYTTKSSIPADIKKISRNKKDEIIEYKDNNGMKQFAINGRRLGFLNNNIKEVDGIEKIAMLVTDIWTDIDFNNTQNEGGISLPSGKKPERLIKRIIDMTTQENDIVLDFFVGSGTTCAVAHKMNRQYIGIEQMDYIEDKTVQRLKNVVSGEQSGISKLKDVNWNGGGSFVYIELKELNKEFINKIGEATKTEELKSIYKELKDKGLLIPSLETRVLENEEFNDLSFEQQKEVIVLAIDKNKLYVNASQVEDDEINLSDYEKELTHNFYGKDSSDDTRQGTLSI